jgi:hypothetical protein
VIVRLTLRLQSYATPRMVHFTLDDAPFGAHQVGIGEGNLKLWIKLDPGSHRLVLGAPAEREGGRPDARLLSVVLLESRIDVMEGY